MSTDTTPRVLPDSPSISHLKKQAKALRKAFVAGEPSAKQRVESILPHIDETSELSLRDAQLVIAREYGYDGWYQLITDVGEKMVETRDLHQWFGTQLNNATWDTIAAGSVGPASSPSEREMAMYSAFASAYHWRIVGNEANKARGEHLISRMATVVGDPATALVHAERCLEIVEQNPSQMSDWDAPVGYEALARAKAALGDTDAALTALAQAKDLTATVADDGDRSVLEEELARGPWFGLEVDGNRV